MRRSAAAQHDLADPGEPGELRDLIGDVVAADRLDGRAQLSRQAHVRPQAVPVGLGHGGKVGRLHIERREAAVKGRRHARSGADDPGVGRRGGQADQNVLVGVKARALIAGQQVHPVGAAPQRDLPQRPQRLQRPVYVPALRTHALQQILRLHVHQLHLIRPVEHLVRDALPLRRAGDGGNLVVQALDVLHVHRGVDVNPGVEQLLHVLIPPAVAADRGVDVVDLVQQNQLWPAPQRRVEVELTRAIGQAHHWQAFQRAHAGAGARSTVVVHPTADHVHAPPPRILRRLKHGAGLAHARSVAKEDLQLSAIAIRRAPLHLHPISPPK